MSGGDLNNDLITDIKDLNIYLNNPNNYTVSELNNIISNWNIVHQTGSLIIYSTPVTINNINYISNVLTICLVFRLTKQNLLLP